MELHKRRKAVTEPEARYFVKQVIQACQYLHNNKVIHRDLKLGNLFINDEMEIKIGDFGLATRLDYDEEAEDPAGIPIYWVSKWVDYSDKYGLGYQLCDNSVGVLFNDSTRLILLANGENIHYIERDGQEHYHTLKVFPETLNKKVTLLKYFRNYMNEHLLKAGANMTPRDSDEMMRLPFLRTWFRTRSAIVLHLSNGTLQINFFQDHTKIILCPLMAAVTYIDEKREFRTFRMNLIENHILSFNQAKNNAGLWISPVETPAGSHTEVENWGSHEETWYLLQLIVRQEANAPVVGLDLGMTASKLTCFSGKQKRL
nr:hypothetical protein BaRGS_034676 [Batillaria attramentaria]